MLLTAYDIPPAIAILAISVLVSLFFFLRGLANASNPRIPNVVGSLALCSAHLPIITAFFLPLSILQGQVVICWSFLGLGLAVVLSSLFLLPGIGRWTADGRSVCEALEARFGSRLLRHSVCAMQLLAATAFPAIVLCVSAEMLADVSERPVWLPLLALGSLSSVSAAFGGPVAAAWLGAALLPLAFAWPVLGIRATLGQGNWTQFIHKDHLLLNQLMDTHMRPLAMDIWTSIFGGLVFWLAVFAGSPASSQMLLLTPTSGRRWWLLGLGLPMSLGLSATFVSFAFGLHFFAADSICRSDAASPAFPLMSTLEAVSASHGLGGVIIGGFLAAVLTGLLSGTSSLATVAEEAMASNAVFTKWTAATRQATMGLSSGAVTIGVACGLHLLDPTLHQLLAAFAVFIGPLLGIVVLCLVNPWIDWIGAVAATFCSFVGPATLFAGSLFLGQAPERIISGDCRAVRNARDLHPTDVFNLHFFHYPLLSVVIYVIIGSLVSLARRSRSDASLTFWGRLVDKDASLLPLDEAMGFPADLDDELDAPKVSLFRSPAPRRPPISSPRLVRCSDPRVEADCFDFGSPHPQRRSLTFGGVSVGRVDEAPSLSPMSSFRGDGPELEPLLFSADDAPHRSQASQSSFPDSEEETTQPDTETSRGPIVGSETRSPVAAAIIDRALREIGAAPRLRENKSEVVGERQSWEIPASCLHPELIQKVELITSVERREIPTPLHLEASPSASSASSVEQKLPRWASIDFGRREFREFLEGADGWLGAEPPPRIPRRRRSHSLASEFF